jgi:hypothetical protein
VLSAAHPSSPLSAGIGSVLLWQLTLRQVPTPAQPAACSAHVLVTCADRIPASPHLHPHLSPAPSSLPSQDYESLPVDEFGKGLLRGLGQPTNNSPSFISPLCSITIPHSLTHPLTHSSRTTSRCLLRSLARPCCAAWAGLMVREWGASGSWWNQSR